jgi:hypothetical protein
VWQAQELFNNVYGGYFESFALWFTGIERIIKLVCSRVSKAGSKSDTNTEAPMSWQVVARMFNETKRIDLDCFLLPYLFNLTVACDVLVLGISEKKGAFWIPEIRGIRKLRTTVISTGSKELTKDYWKEHIISNLAHLMAKQFLGMDTEVKQETEVLLETRQRLENAHSEVLVGLKELEWTLSG